MMTSRRSGRVPYEHDRVDREVILDPATGVYGQDVRRSEQKRRDLNAALRGIHPPRSGLVQRLADKLRAPEATVSFIGLLGRDRWRGRPSADIQRTDKEGRLFSVSGSKPAVRL
jgi:hypothetical protein